MEDIEMGLVFSFPDQSESFTLGFEAGKLWAAIDEYGEREIDHGFETGLPIHEDNLEVVRRMAAARNYNVEVGKPEHGWVGIRLTYSATPKPKLVVV